MNIISALCWGNQQIAYRSIQKHSAGELLECKETVDSQRVGGF